jgi:hypothetical protein
MHRVKVGRRGRADANNTIARNRADFDAHGVT